jgi:hypothetical protein
MNPLRPSSTRLLIATLLVGAFTLLGVPARVIAAEKAPGAEVQMLRDAYHILERADHDYKGHRHAAMHDIEEAAKHLKVSLHGDGKAHEAQPASDAEVSQARGLLQNAHGALAGHKNKEIGRHLEAAIKELDVALSVK